MTKSTVSEENIEQARRELESMLELAGRAKADIERALRICRRQDERIEALRRSLGIDKTG